VTAASGNAGSGIIGATSVTDPATYVAGNYSINFTAANTYQVVNSGGTVVSTGTYTSGDAISFDGMQVTLSGTPATGDSFSVAPSTNQSIFTTVQNLATALSGATTSGTGEAQLSNAITAAVNGIDQALDNSQTIQAQVGARLNTITTAQSVGTAQQTQLKESISNIQSLDYATAITTLDSQNTTLSAAMQAYTLTEGLSLFKYLS
jgi:flagellar hook-associated protein 3 FlgL